ncbi:hypothetical protein CEXT_461771, partial [Caerostris extrusa]
YALNLGKGFRYWSRAKGAAVTPAGENSGIEFIGDQSNQPFSGVIEKRISQFSLSSNSSYSKS